MPSAPGTVPHSERPATPEPTDKQVWMDGRLVPADEAKVSVFDHGLLYGDGVFEGIRCYNRRVFKLQSHLARLYESAKAIRLDIPYSSQQLTDAIRETVEANGQANVYIRLCVTRGVGSLGLHPFICKTPSVFIIADSIKLYPQELYDKGLSIITASTIRNHPQALSPRIKSMNYLNNILAKIEAIDAGVLEAVMMNHLGHVAECTGDNLFIVKTVAGVKTLMTPPLHAGVLEGITMQAVIALARKLDIPVERQDLTRYDLYNAEEMFLTGTAAEVIPVVDVDKRLIGDGTPGPWSLQLLHAFRDLVAEDAPED